MMSYRDQIRALRREYLREIGALDQRIDGHAKATEQAFTRVDQAYTRLDLQLQAVRDQLQATHESIQEVRNENRDMARTLLGRSRLMEERFGKILDVVEASLPEENLQDELTSIKERLDALERKIDPAA